MKLTNDPLIMYTRAQGPSDKLKKTSFFSNTTQRYSLNLGECELFRCDTFLPILNRLHLIYNTTERERTKTGHLRQFASVYDDIHEPQTCDIKTCFNLDDDGAPVSPKTEQGHIADLLTDGKVTNYFFQLNGPLESFNSLILNNIEVSLTLYFSGKKNESLEPKTQS